MMRFIRDIIKEKRTSRPIDQNGAEAGTALDAPVEPLVLKSPMFDEAKPEQQPLSATPPETPEAFMAKSVASDDDAELAGYEDYDDDDEEVQSLLDAIDRERMESVTATMASLRETGETSKISASDEEDVAETDQIDDAPVDDDIEDYLNLPDPFDKLRQAQPAAPVVSKGVSPLRGMGHLAIENPAEPEPEEASEPEAIAFEEPVDALTPLADAMDAPVHMPSPAKGRGSGRSGRVKTRLLGFSAGAIERSDPFEKEASTGSSFPVGWLVVVSEMGRGASFSLQDGVTRVGRGTDQTVCLNFGDNSISRDNHVSIAFDSEQNKFFIGHSGKTNMVRVNNVPLLSTEELKNKDLIRLGETTLRFIAFCADDFSWTQSEEQVARHA